MMTGRVRQIAKTKCSSPAANCFIPRNINLSIVYCGGTSLCFHTFEKYQLVLCQLVHHIVYQSVVILAYFVIHNAIHSCILNATGIEPNFGIVPQAKCDQVNSFEL